MNMKSIFIRKSVDRTNENNSIFSVNQVFPIDSAFYTFSTKFNFELKQWLINVERNAPNLLTLCF